MLYRNQLQAERSPVEEPHTTMSMRDFIFTYELWLDDSRYVRVSGPSEKYGWPVEDFVPGRREMKGSWSGTFTMESDFSNHPCCGP